VATAEEFSDHGGADEAGPACDEDVHGILLDRDGTVVSLRVTE
jgi:hypothetical protein